MTKKTFQKLIIFLAVAVVFGIGALFLQQRDNPLSASSNTCYVIPNGVRNCDQALTEEYATWETWYSGDTFWYNWYSMSNCQCLKEPEQTQYGLNYYEFENVCSFNAYDRYGNTYHNNLPLYPENCPLCLGNNLGGGWVYSDLCQARKTKSECENSFSTNWDYISYADSIFDHAEDGMLVKRGIPKEEADDYLYYNQPYGFQCVWNPEEGCLSYQYEHYERANPPRDEYHYTYKPCNPPCNWRCQKDYGKDGRCDTGPWNGYELKPKGGEKDCPAWESCYCQNHKPVVENISLYVEPTYKDKFEDYDDGKITEYDPLICQATIYDADEEEQAEGKIRVVILPRVNGTRIVGALGAANCYYNPETKRHICTKKFKPEEIQTAGGIRGKKLSCEAIPYDAYQTGNSKISNEFIVAQFNYYFVHLNPPEVNNYKEQYKIFADLSAIDNSIEDTGKPLYLNKQKKCLLTKDDFALVTEKDFEECRCKRYKEEYKEGCEEELTLAQLFGIRGGDVVLPKIDECVKSITGLKKWDSQKDRTIGMSNLRTGFTGAKEDTVFINNHPSKIVLSHELGHTYGLCDEYIWAQAQEKLGCDVFFGYAFELPCDNDYPSCCYDSPENEIRKKLQEEENKTFRDGYSFFKWIGHNIESLTTQELLDLKQQSPCASAQIGGECFYGAAPKEYAIVKEGYLMDGNVIYFTACPPERIIPLEGGRYDFGTLPICYIEGDKLITTEGYGFNCYSSAQKALSYKSFCVGMPLKQSGSIFIEDPSDTSLFYRSIMGYGALQPTEISRYPSKAKYPLNPK